MIADGVKTATIRCCANQRRVFQEWFDENSQYDEIGYGGAKGGGKTFSQAFTAIGETLKYPDIRSLLVRKGMSDVIDNYYDQVMKIAASMEVSDLVQWRPQENCFLLRHNRSRIQCGYLASRSDVDRWTGIEFARMHIEEATQLDADAIRALISSNRSNHAYCRPKRMFTMNPGGPGHQFIKDRFINDRKRASNTLWVQSLITDAPQVIYQNPNYVRDVLSGLPPFLRAQWLKGDWDAMSGQFWSFQEETVGDVEIPKHAQWFAGVDYGTTRPFAVMYVAHWSEYVEVHGTKRYVPISRAHVAHEIYERNMDCAQQARLVKEAEEKWGLTDGKVLYYRDPATKTESPSTGMGKTIAQMWSDCGFYTIDAHTNARIPGWSLMKQLIRERRLTISPQCANLLEEMQAHQYNGSPGPPISDDLQQGNRIMDDASDALRYVIVSIARMQSPLPRGTAWDMEREPECSGTTTLVAPVAA